jgi:hypothetical protein
MKKVKVKHPDIFQLAHAIVEAATDEENKEEDAPTKNQAAVELGRLGGLKGGKARAEKLTVKQRKEIAQKAALTRWSKVKKESPSS